MDENGKPIIENGIPKTILDPRDGSKASDKWVEGFVAQELQEVVKNHNAEWLGIVDDSNPDKLEAAPHKVVIPLVKAVQELSAMVDSLKAEIAELKAR